MAVELVVSRIHGFEDPQPARLLHYPAPEPRRHESREGLEVLAQPVRQLAASDAARSEIQDETFLVLYCCVNFRAAKDEERCPRISEEQSAVAFSTSAGYKRNPLGPRRTRHHPCVRSPLPSEDSTKSVGPYVRTQYIRTGQGRLLRRPRLGRGLFAQECGQASSPLTGRADPAALSHERHQAARSIWRPSRRGGRVQASRLGHGHGPPVRGARPARPSPGR